MKKLLICIAIVIGASACNQQGDKGKFTIKGNLKNIDNQKVYLEELFFNNNNPQVLDTAELKDGQFTIAGMASEQGLYRLRFENAAIGYLFINDKNSISFTADAKVSSLDNPQFDSPANGILKTFLLAIDEKQKKLNSLSASIDSLKAAKATDSSIAANIALLNAGGTSFKQFVIKCIDTINNPVVAMFALGYTRGIEPAELKNVVPNLATRYPNHKGIAGIITAYNAMIAAPTPAPTENVNGKIGSQAPEINMVDTSGKPFLLSSLKGKYVLVDFWASWCRPCRGENPNIVANYNKYKNKNFTILGVSLDEDKAAWTNAIVKDKLSFTQISDLKGWACAATATYGFDAIPYNVLVDPSGKIIATALRGQDLSAKLAEVLK